MLVQLKLKLEEKKKDVEETVEVVARAELKQIESRMRGFGRSLVNKEFLGQQSENSPLAAIEDNDGVT
jgi:hypothetical protein